LRKKWEIAKQKNEQIKREKRKLEKEIKQAKRELIIRPPLTVSLLCDLLTAF
jgi:hypothetical protein